MRCPGRGGAQLRALMADDRPLLGDDDLDSLES